MIVEQVPVDLADKNPPILVSEPRGDGHKVQPRHDAERSEEMSQIVKAHPGQPGSPAGQQEAFAERASVFVTRAALG